MVASILYSSSGVAAQCFEAAAAVWEGNTKGPPRHPNTAKS
jgi:hypothetical protein